MNKFIVSGAGIAVVVAILAVAVLNYVKPDVDSVNQSPDKQKDFEALLKQKFSKNNDGWTLVKSTSIFNTYVKENDYTVVDGKKVWDKVLLELDPSVNYDAVKGDQKTVVVFPTFTASAYTEPGFYTHYRGECDSKCLTIQIQNNFDQPQANPNAVQVFYLLGYSIITDVDIDKDPSILSKYDKVIMLHNEYVTKKEFDAITNHPNVVYLYPNALYAEVKSDYSTNTITLVRGHNYPSPEIRNGFDWKFDNSELEYERDCKDIKLYKVDNGWMLNCYPENIIHKSLNFLKAIKDI